MTEPLATAMSHRLREMLDPTSLSEAALGRVGNRLLRAHSAGGEDVYVKIGVGRTMSEIVHEAERLRWIGDRLPVPRVLALEVISALPGIPAHEERSVAVEDVARSFARAMVAVHSLPVFRNPFDKVVELELEESSRRVTEGLIDEGAFSQAVGLTPKATLEILMNGMPTEKVVFTHGDFALPNLLLAGAEVTGIVDWSLAGVADRHRDFMSAELTLRRNIGQEAIPIFYEAYGISEVDDSAIRYFWLLDQFSTFYRDPAIG